MQLLNSILSLISLLIIILNINKTQQSLNSSNLKVQANYSVDKILKNHTWLVWCLAQVNQQQIATGSFDYTVNIWNISTGDLQFTLIGHHRGIYSLLKVNNEIIASGSDDTTIKIWNVTNGKLIKTLSDHTDSVMGLIKLNDSFILSGSWDKTMKIWSTLDWSVKKTINTPQWIRSLLLLNSNRIAVGNDNTEPNDYKIRVYDVNTGGLIFVMSGHDRYIMSLIQLNSTHIISGSYDKTIKLWDINKGTLSRTLHTFSTVVYSLVNLNNGCIAVSLHGSSNNIALMNTNDWSIQSYLKGHSDSVNSVILLRDGGLASASDDRTAIIWKEVKYFNIDKHF